MKMKEEGTEVSISELVTHIISNANIKDIGKIIIDKNNVSNEITSEDQQAIQADQEAFLQMIQGGGQAGVNQVPPMPGGAEMPPTGPVQEQPLPVQPGQGPQMNGGL